MSRLATRIARLEQALPPCASCAQQRTRIELLRPGGRAEQKPDRCRDCGEQIERLALLLAFDPDLPSEGEQA